MTTLVSAQKTIFPLFFLIFQFQLSAKTVFYENGFDESSVCFEEENNLFSLLGNTNVACSISSVTYGTECDDNGTSGVNDDSYSIAINPVGDMLGANYDVSGTYGVNSFSETGIAYGASHLLSIAVPIGIPTDITVTDGTDPTCTYTFRVGSPAECSSPFECWAIADQGEPDQLYHYNSATDTWTKAPNSTGVNGIESVAYDPNNSILYSANQDQVGTVDVSSGVFTPITGSTAIDSINGPNGAHDIADIDGMSYDLYTDILWASERRGGAIQEDYIFQIDPTTGQAIPNAFGPGIDYIVSPAVYDSVIMQLVYDVDDIAIDPVTGNLYLVANQGGSGGVLVVLDKTDGSIIEVVGNFAGVDDIESLGFFNSGNLFGSTGDNGPDPTDNNKFFLIDKFTAMLEEQSPIDPTGSDVDFEACDCLTGSVNTLAGEVFLDVNKNAVEDSETGIENVTVSLYRDLDADSIFTAGVDILLDTTITDADGMYSFVIASVGDFLVTIDQSDLPPSHEMTTGIVLPNGFYSTNQMSTGNDFGVCPCPDIEVVAYTVQPSCVDEVPQSDGYLELSSVTNGDRYNWSTGSIYTGSTDYASAIALSTFPLQFNTGLSNPSGSQDYTIRVFNSTDDCFEDVVVTMLEQDCIIDCSSCAPSCSVVDLSGLDATADAVSEVNNGNVLVGDATLTIAQSFNGTSFLDENEITAGQTSGALGISSGVSHTCIQDTCGLQANSMLMQYNFDQPVCDFEIEIWDIDRNDEMILTASGPNGPVTYTVTFPAVTTTSQNGNVFTSGAGPNNYPGAGDPTLGMFTVAFDDCITQIQTEYYDVADTEGDGGSYSIVFNEGCTESPCFPKEVIAFALSPSCTDGVPNNDGYLQISAATDVTHYDFTVGSTYTGGGFVAATAFDPATDLPLQFGSFANPSGSQDYTIRVFNGSDGCYIDKTVTMEEQDCVMGCECTDFLYVNDPSFDITHKFELNSDGSVGNEIFSSGTEAWLPPDVITNAHGVVGDVNGNLFISQIDTDPTALHKVACDGSVISTDYFPNWNRTLNLATIGSTLYSIGRKPTGGNYMIWSHDLCDNVALDSIAIPATSSGNTTAWDISEGEDGNLYFSQTFSATGDDHCIYMVDHALTTTTQVFCLPNVAGHRTLGIDQDACGNFYVIVNSNASTIIYKVAPNGTVLHSITDNTLNGSGFAGGWGIIYNEENDKLYVGTLGDDCVAVIDAGGCSGNLSYDSAAGVPHTPGSYAKSVDIVKQCCPTNNNIVIDTTVCNVTVPLFLREIIGCEQAICEASWTEGVGNTGMTYDECDELVTTAPDGCGTYILESDGTSPNNKCGAFKITVNITVGNVTAPVIAGDQSICPGDDPAAFTVNTAASGSNTILYQWQQSTDDCNTGFTDIMGATTDTYDPNTLTNTTYYRVITSVSGSCSSEICKDTSNCLTVTVNPFPVITAIDSTVCVGSTVDLTGLFSTTAGTLTYHAGSPPSGANQLGSTIISNITTTQMFYALATAETCTDTAMVIITPSSPDLTLNYLTDNSGTAGDTVVCHGETAFFGGNVTFGTGANPYTYQWTAAPSGNVVISNGTDLFASGVYSNTTSDSIDVEMQLVVTDDNGCTDTLRFDVQVQPQIQIDSISVFDFSGSPGDHGICFGDSISFKTNVSPEGNYTYSWSEGSTGDSIRIAPPYNNVSTAYYVTVTDSYGCDVEQFTSAKGFPELLATVEYKPSCSPLDGDTLIYNVSGGVPSATGYVFDISTEPLNIISFSPLKVLVNEPVGTVITTIIDDEKGCGPTLTTTVPANSYLAATSSTTSACVNGIGTATATPSGGAGGYTYLWSNSATTQTITGLSAGMYDVTVTDAAGCQLILANITVTNDCIDFDLALKKTVAVSGIYKTGTDVDFEIKVYNQGQITATEVVVQDYIPIGLRLNDSNWDTLTTSQIAVDTIASIAPGDSVTLNIRLRIGSGFQNATGQLINNAEITSAIGGIDSDSDLSILNDGTTNELATDNDINDEAAGTPGTTDNPADEDDYDAAQISVDCPPILCLPVTIGQNSKE